MLIYFQLEISNLLQTMRFVSSRTVRFREIAPRASGDCAQPRNITSKLLDYADIYDTLFYTLLSPIFSNRITNAAVGTRRRLCSFYIASAGQKSMHRRRTTGFACACCLCMDASLGLFLRFSVYRSPTHSTGFIVGNSRTSRMEAESVRSMTRRSTPKPRPPVGGMPYSSAST